MGLARSSSYTTTRPKSYNPTIYFDPAKQNRTTKALNQFLLRRSGTTLSFHAAAFGLLARPEVRCSQPTPRVQLWVGALGARFRVPSHSISPRIKQCRLGIMPYICKWLSPSLFASREVYDSFVKFSVLLDGKCCRGSGINMEGGGTQVLRLLQQQTEPL